MSTIRNGKIVAALATAAAGRFKMRGVKSADGKKLIARLRTPRGLVIVIR